MFFLIVKQNEGASEEFCGTWAFICPLNVHIPSYSCSLHISASLEAVGFDGVGTLGVKRWEVLGIECIVFMGLCVNFAVTE